MNMIVLYAVMLSGVAQAGPTLDTRALIEQALDERAKITLENVKLSEAVEIVNQQTGVKLVMPAEVMDLVPHGADTLVRKVAITDVPLRQGLTQLLAPLGMTFVVEDDHVLVVPKEALLCLGRAPTWPELETLTQLSTLQPGIDPQALASLKSRFSFQVSTLGLEPWGVLAEAISGAGAGPGDEVLTIACENLGWAWCLSDQRIVVAPIERHMQRLLQQPMTLRMNNRPLVDVLREVSNRVNVAIHVEPGALASLPPHMQQNFSLNVHQQSGEQVLEQIAAYTGLGYLVGPDGVRFFRVKEESDTPAAGNPGRGTTVTPPTSDPYIGKIVVPLEGGKSIEWLIRKSEVPPDLLGMRERDLEDMWDAMRRRLAQGTP